MIPDQRVVYVTTQKKIKKNYFFPHFIHIFSPSPFRSIWLVWICNQNKAKGDEKGVMGCWTTASLHNPRNDAHNDDQKVSVGVEALHWRWQWTIMFKEVESGVLLGTGSTLSRTWITLRTRQPHCRNILPSPEDKNIPTWKTVRERTNKSEQKLRLI